MIYVTHDYKTKEFESEQDAYRYITEDMNRQNLSYREVYNHSDEEVQVIVFQYYTLYMETYIVHRQFDLRDRRLNHE